MIRNQLTKIKCFFICAIFLVSSAATAAFSNVSSNTSSQNSNTPASAIHTISIVQSGNLPTMSYVGGAAGAMGLIAAGPTTQHSNNIQTVAANNNISIFNITSAAFAQQLKTQGYTVVNNNADAQLFIKIKLYGFGVKYGFTSALHPMLTVQAQLVRNNQVIWSDETYSPWFDGVPTYRLSDLINTPNNISLGWQAVAQKVATKVLSGFPS